MAFVRSLEMSLAREEFFRLLPGAVECWAVEGDTVRWSEEGRSGAIRLVPLPDRRLGSVEIPRHRIEIELEGWPDGGGEAFLARFLRAFLRGGG